MSLWASLDTWDLSVVFIILAAIVMGVCALLGI